MKTVIVILISIFFVYCRQDNTSEARNERVQFQLKDTLKPFRVVLYSGDEAISKYEINVYKKAGKFYAENLSPPIYNSNSIFTVELKEKQILACINFIKKAKTLPENCPDMSTSVSEFTITLPKETIHIKGDCEWGDIGFMGLRDQLFRDEFADLKRKMEIKYAELERKLIGKWYFKSSQGSPQLDDFIILTKTNDSNSDCFWELGNGSSFKSSCNKIIDLTYSDKFEVEVQEKNYLIVSLGEYIGKNGIKTLTDGATFIIDSIDNNHLKLIYKWH